MERELVELVFKAVGAGCFGIVVGVMAHKVYHDAKEVSIKWLGAMIAVLGGGAITGLFDPRGVLFAGYAIGMASAFLFRAALVDDSDGAPPTSDAP